LVADLDQDFLASIKNHTLGVVQSFDHFGFVFFDQFLNVVFGITLKFLNGVLDLLHNIIGILDDLDSKFVDADVDFLGFLDDEVFVVLDVILEFVQSFDDLWFVFLDLGLDPSVGLLVKVLDGNLDLSPYSFKVSNDLDSGFLHAYPDLLGSINNDLLEFVEFVLALFQSFHDLGFQSIQFVLEEVTDFSVGSLYSGFDLSPDITDSSLVEHGNIRSDNLFSNNDLSDIVDDADDDLFSRLDQSFLHSVELFQDFSLVLIDDLDDDGFDVVGQFVGGVLDLLPDSCKLVLDAIAHRFRDSTGGSSDDADDFSFDLKVDFLGSINDNSLGFVQSLNDLGFEFLDFGNDVVPDISLQLIGGSLGLLPDIIGIFDNLNTEFINANMDFLGFFNDEVFVVLNVITEFVQSFDNLWLVFLNLGLDECIGVRFEVLEGRLNFVPNVVGIFDDLDSEFVDADDDFLGFIDDEIFVVLDIFLEVVQSFDDLGFVFLDLGLHELISTSDEVIESSFNLGPDSFQVSNDLNSFSGGLDVQFLGSINNNFFESVNVGFSVGKSIHDLGFQDVHFVLEVILDF